MIRQSGFILHSFPSSGEKEEEEIMGNNHPLCKSEAQNHFFIVSVCARVRARPALKLNTIVLIVAITSQEYIVIPF